MYCDHLYGELQCTSLCCVKMANNLQRVGLGTCKHWYQEIIKVVTLYLNNLLLVIDSLHRSEKGENEFIRTTNSLSILLVKNRKSLGPKWPRPNLLPITSKFALWQRFSLNLMHNSVVRRWGYWSQTRRDYSFALIAILFPQLLRGTSKSGKRWRKELSMVRDLLLELSLTTSRRMAV